jgi:hypothetical protein
MTLRQAAGVETPPSQSVVALQHAAQACGTWPLVEHSSTAAKEGNLHVNIHAQQVVVCEMTQLLTGPVPNMAYACMLKTLTPHTLACT